MTRSKFLCHILNVPDASIQMYLRFVVFYNLCLSSSNAAVRVCTNLPDSRSIFSRNVQSICNYLNGHTRDLFTMCLDRSVKNTILSVWISSLDDSCLAEASLIVDLCRSRCTMNFLSATETEELLVFLCTLR